MIHTMRNVRLGLLLGALLAVANLAATHSAVAADKKGPEISRVIAKEMTAAQKALQAGQWQEALKELDAADQKSPLTPFDKKTIYDFKAFANIKLNHLKEAQEDYEQALRVDPGNIIAEVNLAELKFRQKEYDLARPGFAALETNPQIGDLAGYKVFLCDLFGAHEAAARQELQAFDAVGENASYYFGNVAWDLFHHQPESARDFLASAEEIYAPKKVELYAASLLEFGYLPLADPTVDSGAPATNPAVEPPSAPVVTSVAAPKKNDQDGVSKTRLVLTIP